MTTPASTQLTETAGACLVSRSIMDGTGQLTWLVRDPAKKPDDTGWRFFSNTDTDETLADPSNLEVRDFTAVAEIEPAILAIQHLPVGADLHLSTGTILDNRLRRPAVLDTLGEWAARIGMSLTTTDPNQILAVSDSLSTYVISERAGRFELSRGADILGSLSSEPDARALLAMVIGELWRSKLGMPPLAPFEPHRSTTLTSAPLGWTLSWNGGDAEFPRTGTGHDHALAFSRLVGETLYDAMTAYDDPEGRPLFAKV